ncbi:MAG: right-handed parallel beta-helix repeat-containing protein [Actinomycetota bacterium]|nr:right-handed parallel beta-helix repeat-containing protein [Actinomycetota bacterium]
MPYLARISIAGLSACLLFASASHARSRCTRTLAAGTDVQAVLDQVRPGQTICLRAGAYQGDLDIGVGGSPNHRLTLTSAPGQHAAIAGIVWIAANDVTVSNLLIDGHGRHQNAVQLTAAQTRLFGNDITNSHSDNSCVILGDHSYGRADYPVISHNLIHDCGLPSSNFDHGIYDSYSIGARITDNVISANATYGVQIYPDARAGLISANIIVYNGKGIVFGGDNGTTSDANRLQGNLIAYPRVGFNIETYWPQRPGVGNIATGNCLWGRGGGPGVDPRLAAVSLRRNRIGRPRLDAAYALRGDPGCQAIAASLRRAHPGP